MGLTVITSAAGHHRGARGRDWLKTRASTEEILIIGATLGAANELARSLAQDKRASFGYKSADFAQTAAGITRDVNWTHAASSRTSILPVTAARCSAVSTM
jgi:hypothetical protein